ncbi:hypothetical protein ACFL6I_26880 [candidate division KSB1 bacterium]
MKNTKGTTKMRYKMDDKRWKAIKGYLDMVWKKPSEYPEGVLLSFDDKEITSIFTKERTRIINILKSSKPMTMTQLAKKLKRKLPAVERDLKILQDMAIVELNKKGRTVYPTIEKKILIIPLMKASKMDTYIASEKSLAKDWLTKEEDKAWESL